MQNNPIKRALIDSNTLKKHMLRDRTDRTWFNCLLQHPTRKRSRSILTTLEPTRGIFIR